MANQTRRSCLICATPRTGSWLLAEALAATCCCREPEEYFRPDWLWLFSQEGRLDPGHHLYLREDSVGNGMTYPDADGFRLEPFLAAVRSAGTNAKGIFSAKLHWHQFEQVAALAKVSGRPATPDEATLREWFPDPVYILLTRRDKLRQAISLYRAIQSDVWYVPDYGDGRSVYADATLFGTQGDNKSELRADDVDHDQVEQLRRLLEHEELQWQRILSVANSPVVRVCYEDVIEDMPGAVKSILDALQPAASPAGRGNIVKRFHRQADDVTESAVNDHRQWSAEAHGAFRRPPAPAHQRAQTIVVENFYADPEAVLEYALRQPYYFPYQDERDVRAGRTRPTWLTSGFRDAKSCPFKSSDALIAALERATGEKINRGHWDADFPRKPDGLPRVDHRNFLARSCLWNCSFHCKPDNGQQEGDGVHNHVTDSWNGVDIDGWAGIIYLSPDAPLSGGLRLWRNREARRQLDWMTGPGNWQLVDSLGNVPNRLILTRGNVPHSGSRGWGESLQSGRIFQTFFFKVVSSGREAPVTIDLRGP
jgi:LPS sulfotransferase NodH